MTWSIERPIAVIAPHLKNPARIGPDISLERVARYLSLSSEFVDLVTEDRVVRYENAKITGESSFANQLRSKTVAGLRSIAFRSHYFLERFNTPAIRRVVRDQFTGVDYGTVLASFLVTVPILPPTPTGQRLFVWTHNDELKWFRDLEKTAGTPWGRLAAKSSVGWLYRNVPAISKRSTFLHVSDGDRRGFEAEIPGHRNIVVSVGTDIDENPGVQSGDQTRVILSFVGALGVQITMDALLHFRGSFEPTLRAAFGDRFTVRIIGSQPSEGVASLCREAGWSLHPNVSDAELSRLLGETTFTILPFAYSNGAKLKLIRSLGSGTPFLSTLVSRPDGFKDPPGCCFSNDPGEWVEAVRSWLAREDKAKVRAELLEIAKGHSWPVVVGRMARDMKSSVAFPIREASQPAGAGSLSGPR